MNFQLHLWGNGACVATQLPKVREPGDRCRSPKVLMQSQLAAVNEPSITRLSRSGYFYCDRYWLIEDASDLHLDFAPFPWIRLLGYSLLLGALFFLFGFAAIGLNSEPIPYGVIVLGSIIIPSPVYFPIIRRFTTRGSRPFLSFAKNAASIYLFAGKQEISLDDVHAVVDATFSDNDGGTVSEVQLSIDTGGGMASVFLVSMLGGAEIELRQVAHGIATAINCRHITFDGQVKTGHPMGEPADARESPS